MTWQEELKKKGWDIDNGGEFGYIPLAVIRVSTAEQFITSLLKKQRDESGMIISACKTKLQLYRANVDGGYMGGVEYTHLMDMIDNFFNAPEPK